MAVDKTDDLDNLLAARLLPSEPEEAGALIRAILFNLRSKKHSPEQESEGWNNYDTDNVRRAALDHAGFCWSTPGEMAPQCACSWSHDEPTRPRIAALGWAEKALARLRDPLATLGRETIKREAKKDGDGEPSPEETAAWDALLVLAKNVARDDDLMREKEGFNCRGCRSWTTWTSGSSIEICADCHKVLEKQT